MPPRRRVTPPVNDDHVPVYDPAVHTDPGQPVFVELYCRCGGIRRQRDPVSIVAPVVVDWVAFHAGDGHGPVSKAEAVLERETRREAGMRALGRGDLYVRGDYPNLDDTCTQPRPWPIRNEED
jgi:hypothetical protein